MRVLTNSLRFIIAASVLCFFGFTQARAETPLIEILKANPEWFGTEGKKKNQLAVTFHVAGNPPALKRISYRWEQEMERDALEFKLGNADIQFMIPPEERKRWYKLVITSKDKTLWGSLSGLVKDGSRTFRSEVLLRPVERTAGAQVELRGSAKHCSLPPDFKVSAGEGLPPELKKFLGYFSGDWLTTGGTRVRPHTLLVAEIIKDGNVVAYYAVDKSALDPAGKPGCWRFSTAKIENGVLKATFTNGTDLKYEFSDPDTLNGYKAYGRGSNVGYFKRDTAPSQLTARAEEILHSKQESERRPQTLAQSAQSDEAARRAREEEQARRTEVARLEREAEEARKAREARVAAEEKARRLELARGEQAAERRASTPMELKGSAKHCNVPANFAISDGQGLPPDLKKFLGFFSGYWDDRLHHTLVVSEIREDGIADTFYSYEKYEGWNINRPNCLRFPAKINDGVLEMTVAGGQAFVKYRFSDPDTLTATYDRDGRVTPGVFKRESERPSQTLAQSAPSDEAARRAREEEEARRAEMARREREAEAARKAEQARAAEEEKARRLELARREREAEEARKVREAEAEKARRAELERGRQQAEEKFWNSVKESQDLKDVHEYLDRYPQGRFVTEAHAWVAVLEKIRDAAKNEFGKYFALVIGIANYRYLPKLKTSVNDAKAVAKLLKDDYGFKVTLLIDPSRLEIINALDEYRETLGAKDNLLIYYAGHGWLDKEVDRGYWLPVDAQENRRGQWVSNATVTDTMKGLGAKHVMVVADSCYSGTLIRSAKIGPHKRTEDFWRQMASKWTRVAITSGGLEPVADSGGSGHSPFAKAFIDVLRENDRVMDGTTLFSKMRRPVMLAAEQTPQYADVRQAGHDGGDFLFVRKK